MDNPSPTIAHPASLVEINVIGDRGLRIVLEERTGLGPSQFESDLGIDSREVIHAPDDHIYEISWEVVVCFAVRGDPFPTGPNLTSTITEAEPNSAFMQWVKNESNAEPAYVAAMSGSGEAEGILRHWLVGCSDASFDVAAIKAPAVNVRQ
ncbi:MAG: hypothetical protein ACSHXD_20025 [Marinosulfonomonas sp.]